MKWQVSEEKMEQVRSNCMVVTHGVLLVALVCYLGRLAGWARSLINAAMPFIVGFCIAFLLVPTVNAVDRLLNGKVFKKKPHPRLSRAIGATLSFVLLGFVVFGFISVLLPQLITSVQSIINIVTAFINSHTTELNQLMVKFGFLSIDGEEVVVAWQNIVSRFIGRTPDVLQSVLNITGGVTSILITTLVALISAFYFLMDKEYFAAQLKKISYSIMKKDTCDSLLGWMRRANGIFAGFITGKIVDSAIIGVLCYFCLLLLRIEYPLLISVVVGVTNVIPFFGPFIGAVPSILILLLVRPMSALKFGIFVLILQQLDGNVIGPFILGDYVGISPFCIMFSIVIGGALFGFVGMLVSVPVFALLYAICKTRIERRLKAKGMEVDTKKYL